MVKKLLALFFVLAVVAVSATTASAVVELGELDTPYNIMYKVYDDTAAERVSVSCCFTDEYAALTGASNESNMAKYGIINASTYVQIDYRIDGGDWHETQVWGTTPNSADYGGTVPGGDTVRTFDLLYLINDADVKNAGALATKDDKGRNVFDLDNHTLEFKVRTTLTYTMRGNIHVTTSPWSEVMKVERNKDFGEAPSELDAPIVNTPLVAYQENEMPYLTFFVRTPEAVKKAEAWLSTQEPTYISLQVEIDKGDGSWQVANVASTGHYVNETKGIYLDPTDVADVSTMKIRAQYIVYMKDKTLYSDYSDVVEFSVPRWEEGKGILPAKCQVCGNCAPLFGKVCLFIAGGVAFLVIVIAAVPVKMSIDKAKAKKAAEAEEKKRKAKEEREAYDKAKQEKKNKNKKG